MIKFIKELGYTFTENNDLVNKQFSFVGSDIIDDEELTVMGKPRFITTLEFQLFLSFKSFDVVKFKNDMQNLKEKLYNTSYKASEVLYPASDTPLVEGNVYYVDSLSHTFERQEDGYLINLTFNIKGD